MTDDPRTADSDSRQRLLRILFHLSKAPVRRGGDTRERILSTAIVLFAGRGYAGTSMRHVATRVGIKAASLYAHFPQGKEQLLREGLDEIFDAFLRFVTEPLAADLGTVEQLRVVLGRHVHWQLSFADQAAAWDTALEQFSLDDELPSDYAMELRARQDLYHSYVMALVTEVSDAPSARERALAILALCDRAKLWHTSGSGSQQTPDQVAEFIWSMARDLVQPSAAAEPAVTP
ncbi:TetR/AcrR family transcriptional regulator [Jiangella asiatica]|uniref:TetR/AcrR family transcriptional regulator n=1 Tax=Jiangella asiatica TaxID=2530372 RepID=UPI0013A5D918|nr:TetR/AcrR family transcriptional regulator [Jiangella asiatica]